MPCVHWCFLSQLFGFLLPSLPILVWPSSIFSFLFLLLSPGLFLFASSSDISSRDTFSYTSHLKASWTTVSYCAVPGSCLAAAWCDKPVSMLKAERKQREKKDAFITRAAEAYTNQTQLPLSTCTCHALFLWSVAPLGLLWQTQGWEILFRSQNTASFFGWQLTFAQCLWTA